MKTIELQFDDQIFEQAERLAKARHNSLEALLSAIIERLALLETRTDPFLGMFAQEPDVVDEMLHSIMQARETDRLRTVDA